MEIFVKGDYFTRSQRGRRAIAARHAGFMRDSDLYTEKELAADPLYSELLWPAGLGYAAGMVIPSPTGDMLFLSVERDRARGPVETAAIEQLNVLRPHLARSALMAARFQLERARAAAEALALIGLPALIFDDQGKVLAANRLIEALTEHIRWRPQNRVGLKDAAADALFRRAIASLKIADAAPTLSFAVRAPETDATMVAHVIPICRSARDIFVQSAGVLLLTPVTLRTAPSVDLVQSLFDLTPAEARVARGLAAGDTVEDIASTGGVSRTTVRTQVRGVLEKTGCRRQAEVVALLSNIAMPSG
jgi:DNA-binding CsgD family transcriptional regulator